MVTFLIYYFCSRLKYLMKCPLHSQKSRQSWRKFSPAASKSGRIHTSVLQMTKLCGFPPTATMISLKVLYWYRTPSLSQWLYQSVDEWMILSVRKQILTLSLAQEFFLPVDTKCCSPCCELVQAIACYYLAQNRGLPEWLLTKKTSGADV